MQEAREASMQTMELLSLLGETLMPHNGEKCWKKSFSSLVTKKESVSLQSFTLKVDVLQSVNKYLNSWSQKEYEL